MIELFLEDIEAKNNYIIITKLSGKEGG